jgi:hypothetical protein
MVLLIGGAAVLGPQMRGWFRKSFQAVVSNEGQWMSLAHSWPPPERVDPELLFPPVVGLYKKKKQERVASLPDLDIGVKGGHAVYGDGRSTLDLYVFPNAGADPDALFDRISRKVETRGGAYRVVGRFGYTAGSVRLNRMGFTLGPPRQSAVLLWCKGCLLLARTEEGGDADSFLRSYLAATSQPRPTPGPPSKKRPQ